MNPDASQEFAEPLVVSICNKYGIYMYVVA